MKKELTRSLLTGRVTAANVNPTADALVALPSGASQADISRILQAPPASLAAADADALAREILAHHAAVDAARDGLAIEDPANPFARAADLGGFFKTSDLPSALTAANVAINDPANPFLTGTDARRFVTTAQADEFRRSGNRTRGLGWIALIVALVVLGLLFWNRSDVDGRLNGHDSAMTAATAALTKLAGDQTGMATQIADHESRIGTLEGTTAVLDGRLNGHDIAMADAAKKQAAIAWRLGRAEKAAIASCVAAGTDEATCRANYKAGKSLYTAPTASAPVSAALAPTPPQAGRLDVTGDALVVTVGD